MATLALKRDGDALILIGPEGSHLGQSLYQELATGRYDGAPPPVDLAAERRAGDFVRGLIRGARVSAVHDISDGGLLVAVAEMALAGGRGIALEAAPEGHPAHAVWFGEDQGRYVVAAVADEAARIQHEAKEAGIAARVIGKVTGDALKLQGEAPLSLESLRTAHERWLPAFMGGS
jgi:phosphoribosylformylglycinamidine synthase